MTKKKTNQYYTLPWELGTAFEPAPTHLQILVDPQQSLREKISNYPHKYVRIMMKKDEVDGGSPIRPG